MQQSQLVIILGIHIRATLDEYMSQSYMPPPRRVMQLSRLVIVLDIHMRAMLDEHLSQFSMSAT